MYLFGMYLMFLLSFKIIPAEMAHRCCLTKTMEKLQESKFTSLRTRNGQTSDLSARITTIKQMRNLTEVNSPGTGSNYM